MQYFLNVEDHVQHILLGLLVNTRHSSNEDLVFAFITPKNWSKIYNGTRKCSAFCIDPGFSTSRILGLACCSGLLLLGYELCFVSRVARPAIRESISPSDRPSFPVSLPTPNPTNQWSHFLKPPRVITIKSKIKTKTKKERKRKRAGVCGKRKEGRKIIFSFGELTTKYQCHTQVVQRIILLQSKNYSYIVKF